MDSLVDIATLNLKLMLNLGYMIVQLVVESLKELGQFSVLPEKPDNQAYPPYICIA